MKTLFCYRYLATGASQIHLSFLFRLGHSTVSAILKECCQALWDTLQPLVLQPPTAERWLSIASDFQNLWQCSNCIGAVPLMESISELKLLQTAAANFLTTRGISH